MEKLFTILVLEDAHWSRIEINAMIRKNLPNAHLLYAACRKEAEMLYRKNPDLDLIIADTEVNDTRNHVPLRRRLGLEFLERIRAGNRNIPLIAYAVDNDITTTIRIENINAVHVIKYPFGVSTDLLLINAILYLLNAKNKN